MAETRKDTSKLDASIELQLLDAGALIEKQCELEQLEADTSLSSVRPNSAALIEEQSNLEQQVTDTSRTLVRNRACEFHGNQSNLEQQREESTSMSSARSFGSSSSGDSGLYFAIDDLSKLEDIWSVQPFGFPSSTDVSSNDISDFDNASLDFTYPPTTLSLSEDTNVSLELAHAPSTLSLSEDKFIRAINEHRANTVGECSGFSRTLVEGDVIFGTARLGYTAVPQAVKIVKVKNPSRTGEQNEIVEIGREADEKKNTKPQKVSFKAPETKATTPRRIPPPNWSPCTGRYTPSTSRSSHNSRKSESSSTTKPSVAAREFFKISCLLIAVVIEVILLLVMIHILPTHNVLGALAMLGLSALFVGTFVCVLVVFRIGGGQCLGQPIVV